MKSSPASPSCGSNDVSNEGSEGSGGKNCTATAVSREPCPDAAAADVKEEPGCTKIRYSAKDRSHFFYDKQRDFRVQVSIGMAGSEQRALEILRLCRSKVEAGASKSEAMTYRGQLLLESDEALSCLARQAFEEVRQTEIVESVEDKLWPHLPEMPKAPAHLEGFLRFFRTNRAVLAAGLNPTHPDAAALARRAQEMWQRQTEEAKSRQQTEALDATHGSRGSRSRSSPRRPRWRSSTLQSMEAEEASGEDVD
ncbi:unnamed protein product [Polarella glacialis]|uniref:Uncharacterized protein n=1 Tax=Polarella glacialis TaxID=89957 RepID=A0A813KRD5_POLGL|nr:unnamed protein product [Polarella glacialis]CAE8711078.1 unnamed protein product [Polarella glacialis]